jgi:hypothetical protein
VALGNMGVAETTPKCLRATPTRPKEKNKKEKEKEKRVLFCDTNLNQSRQLLSVLLVYLKPCYLFSLFSTIKREKKKVW